MPLEDSDWTGAGEEKRRQGFEWGLAALLMGSILGLMALVLLISNILLFMDAGQRLGQTELELANWVAILGVPCFVGLCVMSIVFGTRGLRRARWYDMPAGVPLAGLLMSVAALFLWLIVGADLILILQGILRAGF